MKHIIVISAIMLFGFQSFSQDLKTFELYKPGENAEQQISEAIKQAKVSGKHVFIQVGGNWCIWYARFNDLVTTDKSIVSLIK